MEFGTWGRPAMLERFRAGEIQALEGVYRAYVDLVTRAVSGAMRRYRSGVEAQAQGIDEVPDLVQEVFTRAFEPGTRRRYDGAREYGPYLGHIARNVVVDHLRARRRWVAIDLVELLGDPHLQVPADALGEELRALDTLSRVSRYVSDLPSDLRRVHEAIYVRGLSQRETAERLGVGRQVVRTLDNRLRSGLRAALEPSG